jgi:mRNA interferase YafQ
MYTICYTNRFKQDLKRCIKRGLDCSKLEKVIDLLQNEGNLPKEYRAHKLTGKYSECWECHIKPDWLLVWQQNDSDLIILLMNTGSHSDLFD